MAKSVTNALIGLLVKDGQLALQDRAPISEWAGADDPRRQITLTHLLHMTSGIDNADRAGGGFGFVSAMLFGSGRLDVGGYAANAPLAHPPGTHWAYSTATSNLLGGL